jgi:SPP1 gp7 family putative phage head morphogenesis protein
VPPKQLTKFSLPKRLQRDYAAGISQIIKKVLPPKFPEQTAEQWLAAIAARSQAKDVQEASELLASRMVRAVNVINAKTWRDAAARHFQSAKLYALLKEEMQGATGRRMREIVLSNAAYIRSIPLEQAARLTAEVSKATQRGARPGTIAKMMNTRWPELLRSRVQLIARTESQKASSALTRARSEDVGAEWYVWQTSSDQRVRESHRKMQGVVVPWGQDPDPEVLIGEKSGLGHYAAGDCPNCRCYAAPVLTLDDVKFPARVYWQGSIHQMTKQQFKQIAVGLEPRAA